MSRTKVSEWDSSASANTDINGININEGCPPSTLNNMGREIMSQIKNWQDGSSGDSATNSGTLTSSGTLAITGNVTLDGAAGTSGQYLTSAGSGTPTWVTPPIAFVAGMIMLWSGSEASIPAGWLLCDGTSSTPDLRNKFVVGASAGTGDTTYPGLSVLATGGSANSDLQEHTHTLGSTSLTGTISGATNGTRFNSPTGIFGVAGGLTNADAGSLVTSGYQQVTINATHTHTLANTGSGDGTNKNLPPYYALCYIMKS